MMRPYCVGDAKALLPDGLLSCSVAGTLVVPHFLGENDHPWLRALLEELRSRFEGSIDWLFHS